MPSAAEVTIHPDKYLEQACQKPVIIEKNGSGYAVMMSCEEYERLQTAEDYLWGMAAQEAQRSGYPGVEESMELLLRDPEKDGSIRK